MVKKTAEWWNNECGGAFCSECGLYCDDYFTPLPGQCKRCGSKMSSSKMYVSKEYRLSHINSIYYLDERVYPGWLRKLRTQFRQYQRKWKKQRRNKR